MKRLISAFRISGICAAYVAAAGFSPLPADVYAPGYAPFGRITDRTPVVTNAWSAVSNSTRRLIIDVSPKPDYSTSNAALVATITEKAPKPGNYAAVSNAAMGALQPRDFKVPSAFGEWNLQYDTSFYYVANVPYLVEDGNGRRWQTHGTRRPSFSGRPWMVCTYEMIAYIPREVDISVATGISFQASGDGGMIHMLDDGEESDDLPAGSLMAFREPLSCTNRFGLARLTDLADSTNALLSSACLAATNYTDVAYLAATSAVPSIVTNEVVIRWSDAWDLIVGEEAMEFDYEYVRLDEMGWYCNFDEYPEDGGYWQLVIRWRYKGEEYEGDEEEEIIRSFYAETKEELTEILDDELPGGMSLIRRPASTRNTLGLARLSDISSASNSLTAAMTAEVSSATSAIATASSKNYARMDGVSNGRRFKEAFGKQGNKHRGSGLRYVDEYYFGGCFGMDYGTSRLDDESHFSLWTAGLYDDDNDTNEYFSVYSKLPVSMRDGSITGRDPYVYSPGLLLPGDYGQIPWFSLIRAVDAYGRVGPVFSQSENYILHGWTAAEDAELRQHHPTVAYVNSAVDWVTNLVAKRVTAHAAVSASNLLDRDGAPVDADAIQERAAQQTATSTVPLYAYSAWQTDWPDDDEAQPTMPVWTNGAWAVWVKDPHMTDGPFTVQGSESDTNLLYTLYGYATRFWRSAAIVAGKNAYGLARLADLDAATNELEESLSALNISPVELPEGMAGRGVTFTDGYGEDQNVAVSIGRNARAAVDPSSLGAVNGSTVLRSVSVAIGAESNALDASKPTSSQGIAIGWHAQARSSNAIAIGSGAQHPGETAETGNATVASASTSIAAGYDAKATGTSAIAIGKSAKAKAQNAVQLGTGVNTDANTLKFMGHTLIDALGRIPRERFAEAFSSAVTDGLERVVSPGKMNPVSGKEEVIEPMLNSLSEVVWEKDENGVYSAGGEIGIEPPLGSRNYDILIHDIPAFVGVTNGVPYSMPPEENCIVDFAELLSQGYSVSCAVSPPCGWTNGRYAVLTNAPCVLKVREPSHRRVVVAIKPWNILEDL